MPVVAFAMVISNANRIFLFRTHSNWCAYAAILITGFPGIVFGAVVYLFLSVKVIAFVIGYFLILSIAFPLRYGASVQRETTALATVDYL